MTLYYRTDAPVIRLSTSRALTIEKSQSLHKPESSVFCHLQVNAFPTCTIISLTIKVCFNFQRGKTLDLSRLTYSSILLKLKREIWKNSMCTWKKMCTYDIKDSISTMITVTTKCLLHIFTYFGENKFPSCSLLPHPILLATVSSLLKPH